jgi:Holliday junction resolvasome RuvABC endonuclease subunit
MKIKNKGRILAIDPGTRNIGYAVFENGNLKYFGVKTIPRKSKLIDILKEGRLIINGLLKDFRPQVLVVERTYFGNNSGSEILNQFFRAIKRAGKRKGLRVLSIPVNTVRKSVCGDGWANKEKVVKTLSRAYPQLKPYSKSNREWKKDFHQNMFDAVALGLAQLNLYSDLDESVNGKSS